MNHIKQLDGRWGTVAVVYGKTMRDDATRASLHIADGKIRQTVHTGGGSVKVVLDSVAARSLIAALSDAVLELECPRPVKVPVKKVIVLKPKVPILKLGTVTR